MLASAMPAEYQQEYEYGYPHHGHHRHHHKKHHKEEHELGDEFPQVQSLIMTKESIKQHQTEEYELDLGFAVRRGYVKEFYS